MPLQGLHGTEIIIAGRRRAAV